MEKLKVEKRTVAGGLNDWGGKAVDGGKLRVVLQEVVK